MHLGTGGQEGACGRRRLPIVTAPALGLVEIRTINPSTMPTKKPAQARAAKPGKQHRGQPEGLSKTHDRTGSQPERERHLYPSSTIPKAGSARSNKKPKKGR